MPRVSSNRIQALRAAICLIGGGLAAACATPFGEAPTATNFPTTKQQKLQAGAHWNAVADDAAASIASALKLGKGCVAPVPDCSAVFVRDVKSPTDFAQAFRTQFITSLVTRGVVVAKTPSGATEVDFDIQPIKFSGGRPTGNFNSAALIYGGVWALHGIWENTSPGAAGAVAVGALDYYRWSTSELAAGPTPQHEVIVTTSISTPERYLGRVTNVYYFTFDDESLYRPATRLPTLTVTGDKQ